MSGAITAAAALVTGVLASYVSVLFVHALAQRRDRRQR